MKNPIYSGKRKTAIAKATIVAGKGKILINRKPMGFYPELQTLELEEPIRIAKDVLGKFEFDISVNVKGGGIACQIEAARLAIARALVGESKSEKLRDAYLQYDRNLLVADTRRKEAYKPDDSKARAKRQTSYR
jgi:small subunit ribosomal protein S9